MDNLKYPDCRESYSILEQIGKGGFATVHRAVCSSNGGVVAVKMIDKRLMQAAGMVGRVKQEVSIHSRLKHPSILELYTYFEDQNYVYLVLEYCDNGELQKYIKTLGKGLPEPEARQVMIQVVEGMLYLHSHNILHRDLSLANLLLTKDMRVKIADFGLATQLTRPDEKHLTMCGTPNYISPEVATRSSHGLEADVWGLGCLLYTMLVGRPPFDTDGVKATLTRVVMADFQLPDNLSPEAKDLIKQCLKKNPRERIKLQNILSHPFILRSTHAYSHDSGLASLSDNPSFKSYRTQPSRSCKPSRNEPLLAFPQVSEPCDRLLKYSYSPGVPDPSRPNRSAQSLPEYRPRDHYSSNSHASLPEGVASACLLPNEQSCCQTTSSCHANWCPKFHPPNPKPPSCSCSHKFQQCQSCSHYGECNCQRDNPLRFEVDFWLASQGHDHLRSSDSVPVERELATKRNIIKPEFKKPHTNQTLSSLCLPLSTQRLRPTRQKTKNAIASILDDGEVCLEFLRVKDGVEKIMDVCRISSDGIRIVLYQPGDGRGVVATNMPPPLPTCGADAIYSFENLPSQHFKKYLYAERFVSLVKAKTPKITLYSSQAKFLLMENGPNADAEACFYSGSKIAYSQGKFSLLHNGRVTAIDPGEISNAQLKEQWNRFEELWKHCLRLEEVLSGTETVSTSLPLFPVVVGKRPANTRRALENKENRSENRSPESNVFISKLNSFESSTLQSKNLTRVRDVSPTTRSVDVPGIGKASQRANGDVEVNFFDGSYLKVSTMSEGVMFRKSSLDSCIHYSSTQPLPSDIKLKLALVPKAVEYLVRSGIGVGSMEQKATAGPRY
nr:EOG090X03P9 [Triops cancriformis]